MRKFVIVAAAALLLPSFAYAAPGDLAKAAMNNEAAQTTKLLAAGADPNDRGERRTTALMFAAQNGNLDLVNALLKAGADVKATRDDDVTALHHAAAAGTLDVATVLADAGAEIDAKTAKSGSTPLAIAITSGRFDIAELLFQRGANLGTVANHEFALTWALSARAANDQPAPLVTRAFAERLIAAGADPSKAPAGAAQTGHTTLLLLAAQKLQPEVISLLASGGADPNGTDSKGSTPLLLACADTEFELALRGLGAIAVLGADPGSKMQDPRTLTKSFFLITNPTPAQRALGLGNVKESVAAISARRSATISALLAAGADVRRADSEGKTAVYRLAQTFDSAGMAALLAAGGDPLHAPERLQPPLHLAAKGGYTDVVKAMLSAGADPNARNSKGQTPLMLAAIGGGDVETTIALLEGKADVTAIDSLGNTALHYATGAEEDFLTKRATENATLASEITVLLAAGAVPAARNGNGKTPRDLANSNAKYRPAVALLREAEKKKK